MTMLFLAALLTFSALFQTRLTPKEKWL